MDEDKIAVQSGIFVAAARTIVERSCNAPDANKLWRAIRDNDDFDGPLSANVQARFRTMFLQPDHGAKAQWRLDLTLGFIPD